MCKRKCKCPGTREGRGECPGTGECHGTGEGGGECPGTGEGVSVLGQVRE